MRGKVLLGVAGVGLILVVVYTGLRFVAASFPQVTFDEQMETNRRPAAGATFACPDGSSAILQPWGKVGHGRLCVANGVEQGPWAAWENSSHPRGHYERGKADGEWQSFDGGSLRRTIRYREGVEIYDSLSDDASTGHGPGSRD
jgi:hypothetical protein